MSYLSPTPEEGWFKVQLVAGVGILSNLHLSSQPLKRSNGVSGQCCMELSGLKRAHLRLHSEPESPRQQSNSTRANAGNLGTLSLLRGFNGPFNNCLTNFLGFHVGQAFSRTSTLGFKSAFLPSSTFTSLFSPDANSPDTTN